MSPIAARTVNALVVAVLIAGFAALVLYPDPVVAATLLIVVAAMTIAIRLAHDAGILE